jgi:hypothetical protein
MASAVPVCALLKDEAEEEEAADEHDVGGGGALEVGKDSGVKVGERNVSRINERKLPKAYVSPAKQRPDLSIIHEVHQDPSPGPTCKGRVARSNESTIDGTC